MSKDKLRHPWGCESNPDTVDLRPYELVCGSECVIDDLAQRQDISDHNLCISQLESWPPPPNLRKPEPNPNWTPPRVARIHPLPTDGRSFGQSTMSKEDYDRAQRAEKESGTEAGELEDWEPIPASKPPSD